MRVMRGARVREGLTAAAVMGAKRLEDRVGAGSGGKVLGRVVVGFLGLVGSSSLGYSSRYRRSSQVIALTKVKAVKDMQRGPLGV
jgi:hypothetical protein